jgi:putative DNA primase/helicase
VADLVGRRLAVMSEVPPDTRFNQALLKDLTGGEETTARNPYEKNFRFMPAATFLMAANHRPQVRDQDDAFWRRMRLLPFQATIPKDERDPELATKLEAELDGIFMWALEGAMSWYENGLGECALVTAATQDYERTSDPVREFIDEMCVTGDGSWVLSDDLYQAHRKWAGSGAISDNAFGRRLTMLGFEKGKKLQQRARLGIGLIQSPF